MLYKKEFFDKRKKDKNDTAFSLLNSKISLCKKNKKPITFNVNDCYPINPIYQKKVLQSCSP